MDLFIRAQNTESLTKISNIQYLNRNKKHFIATYYDNLKILGEYKSKERVLQILDEIEKMIQINININMNYNETDLYLKSLFLSNIVKIYEMPKD